MPAIPDQSACGAPYAYSMSPLGSMGMSDAEFRVVMNPFTSALATYARAFSFLGEFNGNVPAADSRAMAELAAEPDWRTVNWLEPSRNAHTFAGFLTQFLADHLAAFAAAVDCATVGPSYAHLTIVRAIVEVSPIAFWLSDSQLTVAQRLRRSIVYRLDSASERGRMRHLPEMVARSNEARARCLEFADHHNWKREGKTLAGEKLPTSGQAFGAILFGDDPAGIGLTLWNLTSANIHGKWYAVADGLKDRFVPNGPRDPHGGTAPIIVDGNQLRRYGTMCWLACEAVAQERMALMGWSPSPELTASSTALRDQSAGLFVAGQT